jgi:hypothetical protein
MLRHGIAMRVVRELEADERVALLLAVVSPPQPAKAPQRLAA